MQEEVDQKTIALAIKTGKLTGQALQAAMKKYLEARKKGKARLPHGQQSLRKLKRDGSTHPPRYIVIFKTKQADNLEQAFKEFTAKKLNREERPSIRKTLSAMKQKAAAKEKQRAKEKVKERGLSL